MGSLHYRPLIACIGVLILGRGPSAQTGTPAAPAFEVASVRPDTSADGAIGIAIQGATVTVRNYTVRRLITEAYVNQYRSDEIIGGPAWLDRDRFAIVGRASRPVSYANAGVAFAMLRTLLAERFKLATHVEQRERAVYNLVLARSDGALGRGLVPSTIDCIRARQEHADRQCGIRNQPAGTLVITGMGFDVLPGFLNVGRRIINRTGLTGTYDVDLHWNPGEFGLDADPGAPPPDNGGPSIFTAVQEQLGLKLEPVRVMVPVLVIDSVERPQEN